MDLPVLPKPLNRGCSSSPQVLLRVHHFQHLKMAVALGHLETCVMDDPNQFAHGGIVAVVASGSRHHIFFQHGGTHIAGPIKTGRSGQSSVPMAGQEA